MENLVENNDNEEVGEVNRKLFHRYLFFFLAAFLIAVSFWLGLWWGKSQAGKQNEVFKISETNVENKLSLVEKDLDFSLFWKTWELLKEKHVNKGVLDAQKLVYGAIKGMLQATGDPYTNFFDPEEAKSFSEDLEGSFEGIGAELGIKDKILTVVTPLDESPAQKAGLRAGDKIIKIGDQSTMDLNIYAAVDLIRGEKGTEVKLTIFREGEENTQEISIIRETIEVKSVKLEIVEENIAYLRINKFGEKTSQEFDAAMNQIIEKETKGIILDLRNNPGGFLDSSVKIASRLMPRGKAVVIEEDSNGNKNTLYTSGGDKLSGLSLVILANEGSASASEILAGALRDNLQVPVIGKKTFGKGSVQELVNLSGGSSVKITIAKWMTPNGDYIMEKGINPDIEVELSLEDYASSKDPQLDKAKEVLRGKIQ
ncbi:S41 family peptidase [Patescibacteria group bacterium]|nr:S41 family peptidase [Patescibacteria group bacterium]